MKRSQTDLYVFKMLPPEILIKVRNYAIKLLIEDNELKLAKANLINPMARDLTKEIMEAAEDDTKRS